MKRLTEYTRFHGSMLPVMNNSNRYSAIERLAAIEDILGDEYDLDELRELVQAKREGRCVVLPRLKPGQGDPPGELGEPGSPGIAD